MTITDKIKSGATRATQGIRMCLFYYKRISGDIPRKLAVFIWEGKKGLQQLLTVVGSFKDLF